MTLVALAACSRRTTVENNGDNPVSQQAPQPQPAPYPMVMGYGAKALPKATAFRMNGDFADKVAVTIGDDGKLKYFPAPSDLTAASAPRDLGHGWWLNRQGLGPNSVFTSFSFDDYRKLPATPSVEDILKAVIPGARVTQLVTLPYPAGEAEAHIDEIREYLKNLKD